MCFEELQFTRTSQNASWQACKAIGKSEYDEFVGLLGAIGKKW